FHLSPAERPGLLDQLSRLGIDLAGLRATNARLGFHRGRDVRRGGVHPRSESQQVAEEALRILRHRALVEKLRTRRKMSVTNRRSRLVQLDRRPGIEQRV